MVSHGNSPTAVIRYRLVIMAVLIFGSVAHAGSGPYLGIGGGFSFMEDANVSAPYPDGTYPPLDATTSLDTGHAVRGTAGYAFAAVCGQKSTSAIRKTIPLE